jgi:hypothetical protein
MISRFIVGSESQEIMVIGSATPSNLQLIKHAHNPRKVRAPNSLWLCNGRLARLSNIKTHSPGREASRLRATSRS